MCRIVEEAQTKEGKVDDKISSLIIFHLQGPPSPHTFTPPRTPPRTPEPQTPNPTHHNPKAGDGHNPIRKRKAGGKNGYALKDLDPDFMGLGRGHLDVLDREGFACARAQRGLPRPSERCPRGKMVIEAEYEGEVEGTEGCEGEVEGERRREGEGESNFSGERARAEVTPADKTRRVVARIE